MQPTAEQKAHITATAQRKSFRGDSCAGSGKTTTAAQCARALPDRHHILYLVFTRANMEQAREPGRFPRNVSALTAHAFAWRALDIGRSGYMGKLKPKKGNGYNWRCGLYTDDLKTLLDCKAVGDITPLQVTRAVKDTVAKFCQSADETITTEHAYKATARHHNHAFFTRMLRDDVDVYRPLRGVSEEQGKALHPALAERLANEAAKALRLYREYLVRKATMLWSKMIDDNDPMAITPDTYLKLFQLMKLELDYDLIILDEYQDQNPCVMDILLTQWRAGKQIIMYGDKDQQIYGFRGAIDIQKTVPQDIPVIALTKSWRFGPRSAELANAILASKQNPYTIKGNPALDTQHHEQEPAHETVTYLCRTNAEMVQRLLDFIREGQRSVHIGIDISRIKKLIVECDQLFRGVDGKTLSAPELQLFHTWDQLQENIENLNDLDLEKVVKIVSEGHADGTIEDTLELLEQFESTPEKHAMRILYTAHRAKGLEWDNVVLADDFPSIDDPNEARAKKAQTDEELNLLYVAATRARRHLTLNKAALAHAEAAAIDTTIEAAA